MKPDKYLNDWISQRFYTNRPILEDYMAIVAEKDERCKVIQKTLTERDTELKRLIDGNRRLNKNRRARIKRRLAWYWDYCAIDKIRARKNKPPYPYYKEYKNELILEFAEHVVFEYELRTLRIMKNRRKKAKNEQFM